MRKLLVIALVLGMVGVVSANELSNVAPVMAPKATTEAPVNIPDPTLQGGDTVNSAFVIPSLPYSAAGTTFGYNDDYDEICPYSGSFSADVVYKYVAPAPILLKVDLCLSSYDTKVYVYDAGYNLVACNDDFYFAAPCYVYSSYLEVSVPAGTYFIIVDGYGSNNGDYFIEVSGELPCIFECVGVDEGEGDMYDGYEDLYNGGCNASNLMFQQLVGDEFGNLTLCANSGWYFYAGLNYRDTDWFSFIIGPSGTVELEFFGDGQPLWMFDLTSGLNCPAEGVGGPESGACPATYTISGAPGSLHSIVMLPPAWTPVTQTWDYRLTLTGLDPVIATEATSWSTLKAMYE